VRPDEMPKPPSLASLREVVRNLGHDAQRATLLADGVHAIVRLEPCDLVARIATLFPQDSPLARRRALINEISVARHLELNRVGSVLPFESPGPFSLGDTWFSLWHYYAEDPKEVPVSPVRVLTALNEFQGAFAKPRFQSRVDQPVLSPFVPWDAVDISVRRLLGTSWLDDPGVARMLSAYRSLDVRIRAMPLVPAHGDAHQGNLLVSAHDERVRWLDFEDVGLMPYFWDAACVVARARLLGLGEEQAEWVERSVLATKNNDAEWRFILAARAVQITLIGRYFEAYGHEDERITQLRIEGARRLLAEASF